MHGSATKCVSGTCRGWSSACFSSSSRKCFRGRGFRKSFGSWGDGTHPGKVFRNLRGVYSTLYDCKYHSQRQVHYPLNLYELSFNIYLTKTMLRLMRNYGVLQVCWTIFCA